MCSRPKTFPDTLGGKGEHSSDSCAHSCCDCARPGERTVNTVSLEGVSAVAASWHSQRLMLCVCVRTGSLGTNAQLSSDFMGGIVNSLAASTRLPNIFDEPEEAAAVDPKKAPDFNLFEWARKQSDAIAKKLFD